MGEVLRTLLGTLPNVGLVLIVAMTVWSLGGEDVPR